MVQPSFESRHIHLTARNGRRGFETRSLSKQKCLLGLMSFSMFVLVFFNGSSTSPPIGDDINMITETSQPNANSASSSRSRQQETLKEQHSWNKEYEDHQEKIDDNDDDSDDKSNTLKSADGFQNKKGTTGNSGNEVNVEQEFSKNNAGGREQEMKKAVMTERRKRIKHQHSSHVHEKNDDDDENDDGNYNHNSTSFTYGVTVVHCKEKKIEWMKDIPKDWKLTVYETCRQNISYASRSFKNAGSEECTAYLSNVIDNYNDLPDINIFLQSDAFLGHGKKKKGYYTEHTPFWTFTELVNATKTWAQGPHGKGYLAYGPDQFFLKNINADNGYLIYYPREYFDLLGLPYSKTSDTRVEGRSGACFAVHKDRIRNIPIEKYQSLKQSVLQENDDLSRRRCCTLENIWHVIFGEPYVIPTHSTVQHLWDLLISYSKDLWPRTAEE